MMMYVLKHDLYSVFVDLPESEAAELQNKLEVLNNIMDQEVRSVKFSLVQTFTMDHKY